MFNREIRKMIVRNELRYYQVAYAVGVAPETLTRWLRIELEPERRKKVLQAIKNLIDQRVTA